MNDPRVIDSRLRRLYGITGEEYVVLFRAQHSRCYVCQKQKTQHLSVDHDHKTGLVRGLLCSHCNYVMGWLHDDMQKFKRFAEYLSNPPAVAVLGKRYVPNSPGAAGFTGEDK